MGWGRMQKKRFVKEYLEPLVVAVLIALFVRTFVVQAFEIPSSSMEPTLLIGDYLLVNKFTYGIRIPYTDTKFFQFKKPRRGSRSGTLASARRRRAPARAPLP